MTTTTAPAEQTSATPMPPRGGAVRSLWIAATPVITLLARAIAPRIHVSAGIAAAVTFAGGAIASVGPIALASRSPMGVRPRVIIALAALVALVVLSLLGPHGLVASLLVDAALVAFAHAAGGGIGRRVQHPGHLLPACVVAAAADVASVVHPSGPTHAVMRSERALSVLAVSFPVPGTTLLAPVLGFGDLLFLALVFAAIALHGLPLGRAVMLAAFALALAGGASAWLETAVPAIVPIAAAVIVGLPEARRLRPEDRKTATIAITVAIAVVLGVLLQRWIG